MSIIYKIFIFLYNDIMEESDFFSRARSEEQINQRQEEIKKSCIELFDHGGYTAVNIKSISEMTSITRSSIYTYYRTGDEILLDILIDELKEWNLELVRLSAKSKASSPEQIANLLTKTLAPRERMLSLYTLLFTNLEQNCCVEKIAAFKKEIIPAMKTLTEFLMNFLPNLTRKKCNMLNTQIITYILGLFPMCRMTEKQLDAIRLSGTDYRIPDFDSLCKKGIVAFIRSELDRI